MTILKTIIKINSKLQDSRFVNELPAEEILCMLKKEIAELSAETGLTELEALMLSGVAIAAVSDITGRSGQHDLSSIASKLCMTNFEILMHFKTLQSLAEKGFISISDFDFEAQPVPNAAKRILSVTVRVPSSIAHFNKKYELSGRFVDRMLAD